MFGRGKDRNPIDELEFVRDITVESYLTAEIRQDRLMLDGVAFDAAVGNWAIYVPEIELKILHSKNNLVHCLSKRSPGQAAIFSQDAHLPHAAYSLAEWRQALSKPAIVRVAENVVSSYRLCKAGLGPRCYGVVILRSCTSSLSEDAGPHFGYRVVSVDKYPLRRKPTIREVRRAGIVPDKTRSCVRDQLRGYVIDINSAVGVVPLGGRRRWVC